MLCCDIVYDNLGGCGSMYELSIEAEEFRGKRMVVQHKMVNEVKSNNY